MSWDTLNKGVGAQTPTTTSNTGWDSLNASAKPIAKQMNLKIEQNQYDQAAQQANSFTGMAGNFIKALPGAFYNNTVQPIIDAAKSGVSQVSQGYNQLTAPDQSLIQRGEGALNIGAGAINTAFSPLAPAMIIPNKAIQLGGEQLAKTPLIKQWGEQNPVDGTLTPAERLLGGIVNATTIIGAAAPFKGGLLKARVKSAIDVVPKTEYTQTGKVPVAGNIPVKSTTPVAEPVNVQTPYLTSDQMPTIQMGAKSKPMLPTIDTNTPLYSPIPEVKSPILAKLNPIVTEQVKTPVLTKPKPIETKIIPIETTAFKPTETKVITPQKSGLITRSAQRVNENLVKQGFDQLPPEAQSKYTPRSYKKIADNVTSTMTHDLQGAIDMATGKVPLSKDIHGHGQILFNAVEQHALQTGDIQILQDLAKSPIGKRLSEAGQQLGEHGFNDNPHSPVAAIQQVTKARETAIMNKPKYKAEHASTVNEIKQSMQKNTPKVKDWTSFIDSITC
jgi:hypothetical protein